MVAMNPRTLEFTGLALSGFCLGYLLPTWLADPLAPFATVVNGFLELIRGFLTFVFGVTAQQLLAVGVIVGGVLVGIGFVLRSRRTVVGGKP